MKEITLGSRGMNRGEQIAVVLGGAILVLYITRFDVNFVWIGFVVLYLGIVTALLLRSQRFVILTDEGIDYKHTYFGQPTFYKWSDIKSVVANSTGVTLKFTNGSTKIFTPEESKWFNFRKFRTSVERIARLRDIHIFIQVFETPGEPPVMKRLYD
jgi:hypothetical protein